MKTGYLISDAMTHGPVSVSPKVTVEQAAKKMKDSMIGSVLIMDGKTVLGICTEQDIVRKVVAEGINSSKTSIQAVMDKNVRSIAADRDIFDAINLMREFSVRHLPVTQGKSVVGIITLRDVMKIEPQLFDLLLDKIEAREEERMIQRADYEAMAKPKIRDKLLSIFK